MRLETTTTATTLSAGRVGGSRGNVLDTANLHAGTSQGTKGGLGTGAGGLGAVTYLVTQLVQKPLSSRKWGEGRGQRHTTSGTDLDVEGSDAELLAAGGDVLGSQHGSVGGGLITVGLDLHTTGDTADGFAATGITQNVSLRLLLLLFRNCAIVVDSRD